MNDLTVIIPFLNEGEKVEKTLRTIRDTAGDKVDILLINDASYDGYDYKKISEIYGASYIFNNQRKGVAASRDLGVENIRTKYFLIVDGHMKFYDNNWWKIIADNLNKDSRRLFCCKCKPLDSNYNLIPDKPSYGAFINLNVRKDGVFFQPEWIRKDIYPDTDQNEIPCVLGASYACDKNYWQYIKGLTDLETYGYDETYISLKVWMEGGRCILLKKVEIGHVFRDDFPYVVNQVDRTYNALLILETLFTEKYKEQVYKILYSQNNPHTLSSINKIKSNKDKIKELKTYYSSISTRSIETVIAYNENVKKYLKG